MTRDNKTEKMLVPNQELKILLAEDNRTIINFLKSVLRRNLSPVNITVVENGHEALHHLTSKMYDIALIDHALPSVKGEEIARTMRANNIEIPLIILALSEIKIPTEVMIGMGVDGIVYKPIEQKELLDEIQNALEISILDRGTQSKFHRIPKEFLEDS